MSEAEQFNHRVIVRGTTADGRRVRRQVTVMATEAEIMEKAGGVAEKVVRENALVEPFFNVYPPSGIRCDGTLSRGHVVADGFVVKASKVAAPAQAAA